ncbi:MAG: GntR family transcriptional regulator [Candidatus Promineifilaceae bacterium]
MDALEQYIIQNSDAYGDEDTLLLRDIAYERLKDAIRNANLPPGEPLSENRLSKLLGISRTPVREALQKLSQEGIVEIIPGRAVRVANRSFKDVVDVLFIRLLLEPGMYRLVAESIKPEQVKLLWDCVVHMEGAAREGNRSGWARADTVWHETVGEACPNQLLAEMALQMRNRIHQYANVENELRIEQLINGTAEHRLMTEAIAAADGELAERITREHLVSLRENLFDQIIYR